MAATSLFQEHAEKLVKLRAKELEMYYQFWQTLNWKTGIIVTLSTISTMVCFYLDVSVNMRTDLLGIAVVFPIVFSINSAFRRREEALQSLARYKGSECSLRMAFTTWKRDHWKEPSVMDSTTTELFRNVKVYLCSIQGDENGLVHVREGFDAVSMLIESLREEVGVSPPELSRLGEWLRVMAVEFELLRNIRNYRTPVAVRSYTKFFLALFPILFGPTFSFVAHEAGRGGVGPGLALAVVYSVVLTGLDNIQETLENPFDCDSIDDVVFETSSDVLSCLEDAPVGDTWRISGNNRERALDATGEPVLGHDSDEKSGL